MTERTRAIVINGPFADWELELFGKLLRDIERSRPDHTFAMAVNDAEGEGIDEALKILQPGLESVVAVAVDHFVDVTNMVAAHFPQT